jgi:hypothetical protein
MRNTYKIVIGNPEDKRQLNVIVIEDNIKTDFKELV